MLVAIALSMFAIGYVLPSEVFLPLALVGILVASFAGQYHARQAGYWQAHMEIGEVMQRVLEGEKSEAQRLGELVDGIITRATAHLQEHSVPWWRRWR